MVLYETTKETVEAELEAVVHAQRVREGESRNERKLPNGPLRAQSKGEDPEYAATSGIRKLPGICWYLAKGMERSMKQGGTAGVSYID